ncbi:hypothetical protein [Nocardioides nanhaiensis]|uniref:Uncharacterized protein n=1 Tax=Nocardioides nanhaiensis TaxID=1476871 RepID=A0ABP8VYC5_9ACTN
MPEHDPDSQDPTAPGDPIDRLAHFDQTPGDEDAVHPLPAAEVRRLGDRRRRRTQGLVAAGAAAAVLAIAVPLTVVGGGQGAPSPAPAPSQTPTQEPSPDPSELPTAADPVPNGQIDLDGLDLTAGMSTNDDGSPAQIGIDGVGVGPLAPCSTGPTEPEEQTPAEPVQRLTAEVSGPEYSEAREVRVYETVEEATAVLDAVVADAGTCPRQDVGGTGWLLEVDDGGLPGDSRLLVRTYEQDGTTPPGAQWWQLTRVGRALVLASTGGEFLPGPGLEQGVAEDTADLVPVVETVCSAQGGGCDALDGDGEQPGGSDTVPADFLLTAGWPDTGSDGSVQGPGPDVEAFPVAACGEQLGQPSTTAVLTARLDAPEDYRSRQLLVFEDAQRAIDHVTDIEAFYTACPQTPPTAEGFTYWEFRPNLLGGQALQIMGLPATPEGAPGPLGLQSISVVRLGRAVVVDQMMTEASGFEDQVRRTYRDQQAALGEVVEAMCAFTEDGC